MSQSSEQAALKFMDAVVEFLDATGWSPCTHTSAEGKQLWRKGHVEAEPHLAAAHQLTKILNQGGEEE